MVADRLFQYRALQCVIALGGLVPVACGVGGVVMGPLMIPDTMAQPTDLDSHWRYLSGLLIAIGLGFWSTIPHIAQTGPRLRLLAGIVIVGGVGRLVSLLTVGKPSAVMVFALLMELVVTPSVAAWQCRLAKNDGST